MLRARFTGLFVLFAALAAAALAPGALAQEAARAADPKPKESVKVTGPAQPAKLPAGGEATVRIRLEIAPSYHVYGENPGADYIPLSFSAREPELKVRAAYPPPHMVKFAWDEKATPTYEGTVDVEVTLSGGAGWPPGPRKAGIIVAYQACTNEFCEDPKKVTLEVPVEVGAAAAGATAATSTSTSTTGAATTTAGATVPGPSAGPAGKGAAKPKLLIWQILGAVLAGLLVTLTPCVYPVIPVTISFFQQQASSRAKAVPLALAYGAGIITLYASLGVGMSLINKDLGSLLGNPFVSWGFVLLFAFLAFSMFGYYDLQLPSSLLTKLQAGERGGIAGALFLGLTLSLVAAPCVGPVAAGLMAIVSQTRDVVFGILAFGGFGLGLALPFMVLGVFSGGLAAIPRAGEWMESVKHVFGYVLLAFAVYFVYVAGAPTEIVFAVFGGLLLTAGAAGLRTEAVLPRALGIALAASGLYFAFGPYVLKADGPIVPPAKLFESKVEWATDHDAALAAARKERKPAMVDFTARWCNACHELDLTTFRDERVLRELRRFAGIKVDVTRDENNQRIKNEVYKAYAIPFIAFYDGSGKYVGSLPREGSSGITTEDVLTLLKEIK